MEVPQLPDAADGEIVAAVGHAVQMFQEKKPVAAAGDHAEIRRGAKFAPFPDQFPHGAQRGAVGADPQRIDRIQPRQTGQSIRQRDQRKLCGMIVERTAEQQPPRQDRAAGELTVRRNVFDIDRGAEVDGDRGQRSGEQRGGIGVRSDPEVGVITSG